MLCRESHQVGGSKPAGLGNGERCGLCLLTFKSSETDCGIKGTSGLSGARRTDVRS